MKVRILTLLLAGVVIAASSRDTRAQTDSSAAHAMNEQQELIAHIVQRVASGVLEIPADQQPNADQLQMIDNVTRRLVSDVALYRAEEQRQRDRRSARNDRKRASSSTSPRDWPLSSPFSS